MSLTEDLVARLLRLERPLLVALDVDDTAQSPARDAVYDSLLVHYPCDNE